MNKPLVTEKLYDADAYCKAFTATVISCEEAEDRCRTVYCAKGWIPILWIFRRV